MPYTQNPELDAAAHYDAEQAQADLYELKLQLAYEKVLAELTFTKATEWMTGSISGAYTQSADEVLFDALDNYHEPVVKAYTELMTSTAAYELKKALAEFKAEYEAEAILK